MVCVFSAFVLGDDRSLKLFGLGMAVAVFVDATIVRMVDPVKLLDRAEHLASVQGFFAEHDIPQGAKTLAQILERQRVNVALRQRESERLSASL